jgi:hypothetical protein
MKVVVLLLAICGARGGAAEGFDFKLVEPVQIEKADCYLNGDRTGGSVLATLRDANGSLRFVHYMTKDAGPERGGGTLSFRAEKDGRGVRFANGSEDERRLLELVRSACRRSFGSDDSEFLKEPRDSPGKKDGFSRLAMAALLRHFPVGGREERPGAGD